MSDYNSYPTLIQSSQTEYVTSETMDGSNNQMSNNNNNIIYNSAPLIVLNSQKSDMALLQNSMMNDGQTYVTIQTQPNTGTSDLNGAKLLNTPIILQSPQVSQYQQQQQTPTSLNVQQNSTQMTSLTPSQLQSLSYLMQTQIAPQFIQTSNGLIQIIPQSFITTQNHQNQGQGHDQTLQTQLSGLPTIGWSIGNFNTTNNPITLDNQQLQSIQMNNLGLPQLIPVQHVIQSNNSFFTNQNDDQNQMVSTIVDLNVNDKKALNKKLSRRKRKPVNKMNAESTQLSSPVSHPTSTNEVKQEIAESSSGKMLCSNLNGSNSGGESVTQYDNKGRPFSFLCPDCPKKFTLNSRLSAHMRCHTGMRPFTCTVCGFSFTQKSYLIRHAAVHKEERPFHCEKCQKSYKHYGSLANHRKLHRKDGEKTENEIPHENIKMEPSDNGRSSSISSLVLNQGYDNGTLQMSHDDTSTNTFTITSAVHSTTTGDNSYIKQLGLYPGGGGLVLSCDKGNTNNIFFEDVQSQQREINEDYDGEEEEEEECEDDDDANMVDLSLSDCHAQNNVVSIGAQYHL